MFRHFRLNLGLSVLQHVLLEQLELRRPSRIAQFSVKIVF